MQCPWGRTARHRGDGALNPGEKVEAVIESLSSIQMSLCHPRAPFPSLSQQLPPSPCPVASFPSPRLDQAIGGGGVGGVKTARLKRISWASGRRRIPRKGNGKQIAPSPSAVTPISTSDSDCNHCAKGLPRRDAPYIRPYVRPSSASISWRDSAGMTWGDGARDTLLSNRPIFLRES